MTADNEVLQEGVKVEKETEKQEIENRVLRAAQKEYEDITETPQFQKDVNNLVEKETELKRLQKEGENIDLIHKKDEQLTQAQMNNAVKESILNDSFGNFSDSVGSGFVDVQQANAMYNAAIDRTKQDGIHIENKEECDRLRQKINSYKNQFDLNGDKWKPLNGGKIYPYLRDGTNIFNINDRSIIREIGLRYVPGFEKNVYYRKVEAHSSSGNFDDPNDPLYFTIDQNNDNLEQGTNNFFVEEEEED